MMLLYFTVLVMLIVAYAFSREGLFTALTMLINVILAGVIAFNFFEPLASLLESGFQGGAFVGFEDLLCLMFLFCGSLGLLRIVTNNLSPRQIEFPPSIQQLGGAAVGLIIGYLVSGFLVVAMQTMPLHQNFLGFERRKLHESEFRRYLPSDRVWLATMRHIGAYGLSRGSDNEKADTLYRRHPTFDRDGTFELRYFRYRRFDDSGEFPKIYLGELDKELSGN